MPQIDLSDCLACVAACPSEALTGQRTITDIWLDARQAADGAGRIVFVCQAVGGEQLAATRIPCRNALPLEMYVALAVSGIQEVTIYTADCVQCPFANTIPQAERATADANDLLNKLGLSLDVMQRLGHPSQVESRQVGVSRRDFLAVFFKRPEKPVSYDSDLDNLSTSANGPRRALLHDALNHVPIADTARLAGNARCERGLCGVSNVLAALSDR